MVIHNPYLLKGDYTLCLIFSLTYQGSGAMYKMYLSKHSFEILDVVRDQGDCVFHSTGCFSSRCHLSPEEKTILLNTIINHPSIRLRWLMNKGREIDGK